jgi:hypothetical protein
MVGSSPVAVGVASLVGLEGCPGGHDVLHVVHCASRCWLRFALVRLDAGKVVECVRCEPVVQETATMKDCWLSLAHPPKPCRKCWIRCFVFAGAAGLSGRCPVVLLAERIEFAFELRREPAGCDGVEKSVLLRIH